MKKRIICIALLMICLLISSCGGNRQETKATQDTVIESLDSPDVTAQSSETDAVENTEEAINIENENAGTDTEAYDPTSPDETKEVVVEVGEGQAVGGF